VEKNKKKLTNDYFVKAVQTGSFAAITQKCNKTASIKCKKTAVYTQVNGE